MQHGPSVLATIIDPSLGALVGAELRRHGVTVMTGVGVESIERAGGHLTVAGLQQMPAQLVGAHVLRTNADLVLAARGVRPQTELARSAGVTTGSPKTRGAITVTRAMETNVGGIYAAGDCVETWHCLLQRPTYLPLGTTAHKQGRIAGANAALDLAGAKDLDIGGVPHRWRFAGTPGTQVVKVFDLVVARTGPLEAEARAAGFDPVSVQSSTPDHKQYYPGVSELHVRITGDRRDGRLLGAQIIGQWHAEIAKRINILATALFHAHRVAELSDLDELHSAPQQSLGSRADGRSTLGRNARTAGGGADRLHGDFAPMFNWKRCEWANVRAIH